MGTRISPVGTKFRFNSKEGGGAYTVVGHINCERCKKVIEDREWTIPSRKHRKKGKFYSRYSWCPYCGLYQPDVSSREITL